MRTEIAKLKKEEIIWLAEHSCKHRHTFLSHFRCFKSYTKPRVIFLDLEVSPQQSMTYGKFHEASILSVVRPQYIFCFSYKEIDSKKTKVVSLTDFPLYKKDPHNDRDVVKALYEVIAGADYIIAHNIAFDIKMAKARFIKHNLEPLKKLKTICTLKLARKIASFPSNTLKELALFLGVGEKMEAGKTLWQRIYLYQDKKAWKAMKLYNKVDSEVGTQIFKILEGWSDKQLIK